ncbi:hypothetical protein B0T25DRAFT_622561 [Lasiosphaeria hispida]|uniref:LrgB-like protein n=1 Tax=Lasiosphaeria hispida TaxID=260671 RepID=A0AAJ0HN88_9PEZI|nr:hypothetical protein B0T25DRAFT_622561 [Lasiosphaeria hispida]
MATASSSSTGSPISMCIRPLFDSTLPAPLISSPVSTAERTGAVNRQTLPRSPFLQMRTRLWNGLVAVVIALLAQLLIAGIQYLLSEKNVDFPPSILAMAIVFSVFLVCGRILPGVELFYQRHLRQPADLLNRHMSIGFTIPFVMICRSQLASPRTIGLIIACFILTGVLNTFSAYALSLPLQGLMVRWDKRFCDRRTSKEEGLSERRADRKSEGQNKLFHEFSSILSSVSVGLDPEVASEKKPQQSPDVTDTASAEPPTKRARLLSFALDHPMLLLSWTLALVLGVPLRLASPTTTILSTTLLSAIWLTTLTLQSHLKTTTSLPPALRTLLSALTNAVLCTSLALIAFAFTESALSHQPLPAVLATLQTNTTLSDLILSAAANPKRPMMAMAAGDITLSILNAGLVSWGLKLYEYRAQLLSRAGLTVFSVSSLLALGNVALGPPFARAVGLGPAARDLAFAARSVTLALGSPVMAMLGGDSGLNAAMVVVSGIVFQMGLGFGVGGWMERVADGVDVEARGEEAATAACCRDHTDDPRTVAAGVTIGINAAAMGTAYLYEVKSEAAPYSALSMMALGIMTVVFSTIQPLAHWVVEQVASAGAATA